MACDVRGCLAYIPIELLQDVVRFANKCRNCFIEIRISIFGRIFSYSATFIFVIGFQLQAGRGIFLAVVTVR